MKLYRIASGAAVEADGRFYRFGDSWDELIDRSDLLDYLAGVVAAGAGEDRLEEPILAPVASQEVWAAGVTYVRSRQARREESKEAGGGAFYDRVYEADRPELFLKAAGWRVRGPGQPVRVRRDSKWSVPEPELALCANSRGEIVGYTIGNDMSARDLEGENPLYLPQAKIFDGACALGPALRLGADPPGPDTTIRLEIGRVGTVAFAGETTLAQMRRTPAELVSYLYRETTFPHGCVLLTGTGIVPPDDFTLEPGDEIRIEIETLGTLVSSVTS